LIPQHVAASVEKPEHPVPLLCGSGGQRCTPTFPNLRDPEASYTLETNEGRATDKEGRGFFKKATGRAGENDEEASVGR
jgi:hypothetical protein